MVFSLIYYHIHAEGFCFAEAYDSLDPNGNITIKWDIMQWTPDGYVVSAFQVNVR